ncbi:MAG: hypothetical protein K2H56_01170 [Malacoplasma sp.]|nr:hypothetical protein [Malacoplasma sp.]
MNKKFKELLMIYFFEKAIVLKNINKIIVPLFNNINIDWSKDWNQQDGNMSVCFDFNNKSGNNFKLCTMKECEKYVINKINRNLSDTEENLGYLIARAKMTENLFEIFKRYKDNKRNNHLIGLFGEYYVANKILYGNPAKNKKNFKNFYSEDYVPKNLEYIEKICTSFDRKIFKQEKNKEEDILDISYLKPNVFKLLWMRNKDQFFSDSDFIISYPVYYKDSSKQNSYEQIKLKGYCIKFLEIKSTEKFFQYYSKEIFENWTKDKSWKRDKYWYDSFELSIQEFNKLKNNKDYILLRLYGINYNLPKDMKENDFESEEKLKNLKIKHSKWHKDDSGIIPEKAKTVLVLKIERHYIIEQIFEFFKHLDLFKYYKIFNESNK